MKFLIVSLHPYFLEKENSWFVNHFEEILKIRERQVFFQENTLVLEKGLKMKLSNLVKKLEEMGYERVLSVREIGDFSWRGNIVEVFPVNSEQNLVLEFFGNQIENIQKGKIFVKDEKKEKEFLKQKIKNQNNFSDLTNLKKGEFVVHLDHGIGIFQGITKINKRKYYEIEYKNNDKIFVPLGLERKLTRYLGFQTPTISTLEGNLWQKIKTKAKKDAQLFAKELLEIYATKETIKRKPYLPEDEIYSYIEQSFPFKETPDQALAISKIKEKLEQEKLLDLLIVGDVGFGKTEVALRAMIKVVSSGFQTALLSPTTILAHQHYLNFKERLKNLPIDIAILSRIQTKKEQKETLEKLKTGKIDILIGTHRILSDDVVFKNLGLLVIDDEHKFGVRQKEKLRKKYQKIDIISLSATPIPRTLFLALSSIKDMILIKTPPEGRKPVKIFILPFSLNIIKKAIKNELKRGGQVYYLHNRVQKLEMIKTQLEKLFENEKDFSPRFDFIHGQMKEKEIVKILADFQERKIDVLITTTIIEAGIDFPKVNTIIVDDVTKLGLSQLYQLKGRIGRSDVPAFAYFLFSNKLTKEAKRRLRALKKAEQLGSGYEIALEDLKIRGAGEILGKRQSGHINRLGLNLYCQMLNEAVLKLKENF